jgi:hypothetical protein
MILKEGRETSTNIVLALDISYYRNESHRTVKMSVIMGKENVQ